MPGVRNHHIGAQLNFMLKVCSDTWGFLCTFKQIWASKSPEVRFFKLLLTVLHTDSKSFVFNLNNSEWKSHLIQISKCMGQLLPTIACTCNVKLLLMGLIVACLSYIFFDKYALEVIHFFKYCKMMPDTQRFQWIYYFSMFTLRNKQGITIKAVF